MDERLRKYYERELQFIREMGEEFAAEYPKIAGRLSMQKGEIADPFVERLLEGFAFLAARVQLQLDSSFPRFTQYLLELVYPNYLAPTPSMLVCQLNPDLNDDALAKGPAVSRGTVLRSVVAKGEVTACEFRTAQETRLWPVEITDATYFSSAGALASTGIGSVGKARAGIRLRLKSTAGLAFNEIAMDTLSLYLTGQDELPNRIYEQLLGNVSEVIVRPKGGANPWVDRLPGAMVQKSGFADDQALLPEVTRGFKGYRLLQEYFAFPERFLFVDVTGLKSALQRCEGTELEIIFALDQNDSILDDRMSLSNFSLNCVPAINLIQKRASRIRLDDRTSEYHLVPDRTRPMDYEVHSILSLTGFGDKSSQQQEFKPFYASNDLSREDSEKAYFVAYREPRRLSQKQKRDGPPSSYIGSEVYLSLVDRMDAPFRGDVDQLEAVVLCTNRFLPLSMRTGQGQTDLTITTSAPVQSVRVIAGPTRPLQSKADGDVAWRLISQLSLNYLSIVDAEGTRGGDSLRELLSLYAHTRDVTLRKQLDGIVGVGSRPVTRRIPVAGPVTYGRGVQIAVTFDDGAYAGTGVFLLGAVLDEFFARYASINAFTETMIKTTDRGEVMRWPARLGRRQTL